MNVGTQLVHSVVQWAVFQKHVSGDGKASAHLTLVAGISAMKNNMAMLELSIPDAAEVRQEVLGGCALAAVAEIDVPVQRHGDHFFAMRSRIDMWMTINDLKNAAVMIMLGLLPVGRPDLRIE